MCHVFPLLGPCLVCSCPCLIVIIRLIHVQLCLCNYLCILVPACSVVRVVWSTRSAQCFCESALPVLPCPGLMSLLKTIIWFWESPTTDVLVCASLFLPAVCTVTEDQTTTVSGAHSPVLVSIFESLLFVPVFVSRGKEVAARHPALARG